jgi:acyl-CoA thioesterase II
VKACLDTHAVIWSLMDDPRLGKKAREVIASSSRDQLIVSDMTLLDSTLVAHGRTVFEREIQAASLDHALWFHRPFRADEWLLYAQDSPSSSGALGFSRGLIFNIKGQLVASVAQEGLIRPRPDLD